jgi:hypothetical protein
VLWNLPCQITKWGQFKDSKWSRHKIETFREARDFFGSFNVDLFSALGRPQLHKDHDSRWSMYDENVLKLSKVSFQGGHKNTPVKHKVYYSPPQPFFTVPAVLAYVSASLASLPASAASVPALLVLNAVASSWCPYR